jgi:hypothetical protein
MGRGGEGNDDKINHGYWKLQLSMQGGDHSQVEKNTGWAFVQPPHPPSNAYDLCSIRAGQLKELTRQPHGAIKIHWN